MKKNLVFLGPPGSGKGTQAIKLAQKLNIAHLSTGDILRNAVKEGTRLGKEAERYMKNGELVPDHLLIDLIESKVTSGELNDGFILDGFPRTVPQAKSLKEMFDKNGVSLEATILFQVADDEVVKRLSGRWFCPKCQATYNYPTNVPRREGVCDHDGAELVQRPDDSPDVVANRLETYHRQTEPLVDYYKNNGTVFDFDAGRDLDEVTASVFEKLDALVKT